MNLELKLTGLSPKSLNSVDEKSEASLSNEIEIPPDLDLGPLPEGWEMGTTENGDQYFIEWLSFKIYIYSYFS